MSEFGVAAIDDMPDFILGAGGKTLPGTNATGVGRGTNSGWAAGSTGQSTGDAGHPNLMKVCGIGEAVHKSVHARQKTSF